ncbi:hypothetical protein D0850_16245 [Bordetella avium]|uniref:hypothetical protein n=1 Tax=Bordetella avium TaxID=521 RepID=UPI000E677E2E|nr:hypothetical protein [Bordetella avium]RIQ16061.1 hypothetical protein D0850_16245 [Bordetella avium]
MSKAAMPEPVAAQSKFQTDAVWANCSLDHHKMVQGNPADRLGYETRCLFAADQMEAYATAKVREALEAAAQACEARIGQHAPGMKPEDVEDCDEEARLCAGTIRALIPSTPA